MQQFKIIGINVHPIDTSIKGKESFAITIVIDFFGNKLPKICFDSDLIRIPYDKENPSPIKIQIFEHYRDSRLLNGSPIPFSIIFYEMNYENRSNQKFIDLIYEHNKDKKTITYIVVRIDKDYNWIIKDINETDVKVTFIEH